MSIQQTLDLAKQHHDAGRWAQAESLYRQLLAEQPDHAEALHLLGTLALQTSRPQEAAHLIGRAVELDARCPEYHCNLGLSLAKLGRMQEAVDAYHRALAIRPEFAEAFYNLGIALRAHGRVREAIAAYRAAIALKPNDANAYSNLGNALTQDGQYEQAFDALRTALALQPDFPGALWNLGIAMQNSGRTQEAIALFSRLIEAHPDFIDAYENFGAALQSAARFDEAGAVWRRGLALRPDAATLHWNLGLLLLLQGDFQQGWPEYEWRKRVPAFRELMPDFTQPMWDGGDLRPKRILLHAEQGFGDTIHFARYVQAVAAGGGKILLACQPKLLRLMKSLHGVAQFVATNQALPDFDLHCPLPSLPHVLGLHEPQSLPWRGAYLHSEEALRRKFADVLEQAGAKLKVGLVWAGRALPPGRSVPLAMLAPLADPRVQFYSLQVGEGAEQAKSAPSGMQLSDATDRISDFADTAALMDQLDLIVSIDTAAAQLAGAMGKAVWTLLKHVPDWRWMLRRSDSPWYPTMRLFRQEKDGDWTRPIQRAAMELKSLLAS